MQSPAGHRHAAPVVVLAVSLAAPLLAACSAPAGAGPLPVLRAFVADWSSESWAAMSKVVLSPAPALVPTNVAVVRDLGVTKLDVVAGAPAQHDGTAAAPVTERLTLAHLWVVVLHGIVHLVLRRGRWHVRWSPSTIDTRLGAGDRFVLAAVFGRRGSILGAGGVTLTSSASTVTVGVQGSFVKNRAKLVAALVTAGATPSQAASAITAALADPSAFVPVVTVSVARYEELKPAIYPVPGTVFRANGATPASPGLAAITGTLGSPTAAQLKALGWPYTASSLVGIDGIEETEQSVLAGRPGATITIVDRAGETVATIASFPPGAGTDVTTSIDPAIEAAAENALGGLGYQAALVAIRASTGQVVAAVNTPSLGTTDLALDGQQPPGSTFKVITSTALVEHGLTIDSPASCPPVVNVDGENFYNAEGEKPISTLLGAFTESCNTAFIQLVMADLEDSSLHAAAAEYDIGDTPQLGAPAFGGSVPDATGPTDLAAGGIGQAEIVMNPLDLAGVAAAVDTGVIREPRLVAGAPDDTAPTHRLPAVVVADLHTMMAAVVASGTAAGTGLPPGTFAKTGTAEYGTGSPLPVDAWLMGFNGDIAFATCLVDAPGYGGPVDGPIVARFLDAIDTSG